MSAKSSSRLRLIDRTSDTLLTDNCVLRRDPLGLTFGLMGRHHWQPDAVLGLTPCDLIHTMWVPFPIDAVFCDRHGKVLSGVSAMRPWQIGKRVIGAVVVWESRAGLLAPNVSVGDFLEFEVL